MEWLCPFNLIHNALDVRMTWAHYLERYNDSSCESLINQLWMSFILQITICFNAPYLHYPWEFSQGLYIFSIKVFYIFLESYVAFFWRKIFCNRISIARDYLEQTYKVEV